MKSFNQTINSLHGNLNTVTKDVKLQGAMIEGLNTRVTLEATYLPPLTTDPLALADIAQEIQLQTRCNIHIIIRGVPELSDGSLPSSSTADKTFIEEILGKLEPIVPEMAIHRIFRIGKSFNEKLRLLKVKLPSNGYVNRVVTSFLRIRFNHPTGYSKVSSTKNCMPSERSSIYEIHQELRDRQEKGESNITILYFNELPKIVLARTNLPHQSKNLAK